MFEGPASFTGEDVAEFHGHGGILVTNLLLEACLSLGARLARPGEFSERAFLNNKLDDLLEMFGDRKCKSMIELGTGWEKEVDPR